jgi:ribonuclease BN (tRNA processing enzyme)
MVSATEAIASGVYRVDATKRSNSISVLLVAEDDGWALVDTGVEGSSLPIQEALASLGAGPSDLRRIYLTHHDPDHIGGLSGVKWWAPEAEVVSSELEAQVISGERPSDPKSNPLIRLYARRLRLPTAPVDSVVHEGDLYAWAHFPAQGRGWPSLHRRRIRLLTTQAQSRCEKGRLRGPRNGQALGGEAARGRRVHDRRLQSRQTVARGREGAPSGGSRRVPVRVALARTVIRFA